MCIVFPLTPALSRRERENQSQRLDQSGRLDWSGDCLREFPRPKGQGEGEGKGINVVVTNFVTLA